VLVSRLEKLVREIEKDPLGSNASALLRRIENQIPSKPIEQIPEHVTTGRKILEALARNPAETSLGMQSRRILKLYEANLDAPKMR
jgi:hypothetical protein